MIVREFIALNTDEAARLRQYKSRISQWNHRKNIKSAEMKWIVGKRQKRRLVDTARSDLVFHVRGVKVSEAKINRWMNTHGVTESMMYAPASDACQCTLSCCLLQKLI